jgi:hypothetical protein
MYRATIEEAMAMDVISPLPWFRGLYMFKELIKLRCKWHGDVLGKWSECLYVEDERDLPSILEYLETCNEGVDYKWEDDKKTAIWIA